MKTTLRTALRGLVILWAVSSLAGCFTSPSASVSPIRVGTYNIRLSPADKGTPNAWNERKADMVALLKGLDLDAGGLQEVCPDQAQYLRENMPEYEFVGEHREADRVSGEASPVFFRRSRFAAEKSGTFWLSETPDVPGLKGWDAAHPRVCSYLVLREKSTGRRFCFANTHTDHKSALAREQGMLLIIERMKDFGGGAPIIFTGDHNCRETEAPAVAVSALLKNAILAAETTPDGPWRTFNGWEWREKELLSSDALKLGPDVRNAVLGSPDGLSQGGGYDRSGDWPRIDYIYVSPGVRVLDYKTVGDVRPGTRLYPSDHFPVVATVLVP